MQSGVLAVPSIVSQAPDLSAVALMASPYRLRLQGFAAMAQPVIVDTTAGQVYTFRGTRLIGYVYNHLIKEKCDKYFPQPQLM